MIHQRKSNQVELDDIDRKLIRALIADGRATYAKLAPIAELSQAAVRTRVQRLLDDQIITITGRVDPSTYDLGLFAFVFLEVSADAIKVARRVSEVDSTVFVVASAGSFDVLAEVRTRDEQHLLDSLDQLRGLEGVRRLQSSTVIHYEKHDWTGVGSREPLPPRQPATDLNHEFDEIDQRLLYGLMADGRATYSALAPTVGLSQAAVRDRVIDLLESRIVTIQAHPVPEAMGIAGFAGIAIKADGAVAPLADALTARPETTLVARTLGRFDLVAEVWFETSDHLAELLDELREMPGVGDVDPLPYLSVVFEEFTPSLDL